MASGGGFICPICITEIDPAVNRWVQESCGHRICRNCFMESEDGCTQCKKLGASSGIDANMTLGDGPKNLKTIIAKRGKERNTSKGKPPLLLPIGIASSGSSNESVTFASTVGVVQGALSQGKVKRSRRKSAGNLNSVWQEELCKSTGKKFATVKKRARKSSPAASVQKKTGEHRDGGIYAFTEDNLSENDEADEEDDERIEEEYQQGGLGKKKSVAFESTNGNDGNVFSGSWDNASVSDREGPRPQKFSSQLLFASAEHAITAEEGPRHAGPILMSFANRGKKSLLDRSRNDSESRSRSASFSDSSSDASIEVDRLALDNPTEPTTESNSDFSMSCIDTSNSKSSKTNKSKKRQRHPVNVGDHINVIPGNDDSGTPTSYECTVCYKKFKTKAHIKYHDFCRTKEKPFKCEECGQGFIAKSHYEYHLRTHTGERPYVCKLCGRGFNQRGKVTRHMRSHTGEKPFICQQCGRGFANAQALRSHFLIHTGVRPFACQFCDKRFTGMTNLKKHVITHTGERPYTCTHCGKSFGLKWTLDLHLRTHSTERPYACDQCTRAFSNSKDLRRHLVIHSGERPFKCWICGTAFRRKDNLDRHIKNTHNQPKEIAKQLANEAAADYQQKQQQREAQSRLGSGSAFPATGKNKPNILKSKTKSSNHALSDGQHRSTKGCRLDFGQEPLRADSATENEITIPLASDLSSEQMTVEQIPVAVEPQATRRVQFKSQSPAKPRSVSCADFELPTMHLTTGSYSPVFRHSTPSTVPGGFEAYAVPGTSAEAPATSSVLVPRCVSETIVNRTSNIRPTVNVADARAFISHVVLPTPPIPRQKVIEVANFDNGTTEVTIREELIKMEAADAMEENETRQQDPFLSQAVPPPTYFFMNASDGQQQSLPEESQESDSLPPPIMRVNAGTMTEPTEFENTLEPETTQEFGVQTGDCFSSQFNSDLLHDMKPFPRRQDIVNHVTATSQTELSTMPKQIENFQNGSSSPGNGSKEFAYFLESESRVEARQSVDAPKIVSYCSVNLHHGTGEIARGGNEFGSVGETANQATGNSEVRPSSSTAALNDVGFTETGFENVDEDSEERSRRPGYYRGARLFDIDLDSILPRSIP